MVKSLVSRDIPKSCATVGISVIDTTTYLNNLDPALVIDPVYQGHGKISMPSFSFLIHHAASDTRVLFDLGLRKNWATHLSPHLREVILGLPFDIACEKDTADILADHGPPPLGPRGRPDQVPLSTKIVTGPGYTAKYLPGWPEDPTASETTSDLYDGRSVVEITFEEPASLTICDYRAVDYFGDGSFYLLDSPGHTTGHLTALARTTTTSASSAEETDTFIFLAADTVHHAAVFRPTDFFPLPDELRPIPGHADMGSCCASGLYRTAHRLLEKDPPKASTTPFCLMPPGNPYDEDHGEAERTVKKMLPFDGDPDVFTIFSHDDTLLGAIDLFPMSANHWKAMGWKERCHWRFLRSMSSVSVVS
ncbi:hypothetical protein FE257_008065 [Aspergillus nanangensis]|uniref:Metallo-beta-lactamase domain-containing protein n=1 Tax=Aspergillus nanangensis TaxID=2582783 RepID=A0AAD4CMR1_ASPNN|nr:hypothetical protein FE257_008065 [Aspergillus nanangensis]